MKKDKLSIPPNERFDSSNPDSFLLKILTLLKEFNNSFTFKLLPITVFCLCFMSAPQSASAQTEKPLFAAKTNLLFDAVSALNVEIEVPIGKRWSIAGEYIFPWWLLEDKQIAVKMLCGNLEGRYWFGNRADKKELIGWYMGLYAGGGYFDLEWKNKGYQGEFFIATGLSGGYAHTISKNGNWRMEYGFGVGYMQTKYREYVPKFGFDDEWHLIRQRDGIHRWLGPTKAKVSLVWMINYSSKKKGGAR